MHGTFVPKNFNVSHFTSLHFTSLQNKITSHISRQLTQHHYTSHHFTCLHWTPIWTPLLVTTFLTLFLKVFSLQGKDANKPAGNWFLSVCRFSPCQQPPRYYRRRNWKHEQFCVGQIYWYTGGTKRVPLGHSDIGRKYATTWVRACTVTGKFDGLHAPIFMMHVE